MKSLLSLAACALLLAVPGTALAQPYFEDESTPARREIGSPEKFALELRVGPYDADMGDNRAFDEIFSDDSGPMLGLELDFLPLRLKNILYAGVGGAIGRAAFTGKALDPATNQTTDEETHLTFAPLTALAVVRIDALPRQLSIPFILTAKLGYTWAYWSAEKGGVSDATGWSNGLWYAGQLGLDLDTFDKSAARMMDEEWGINHSYLFFELNRFKPNDRSLELGGTNWLLGLGFIF